MVAHRQASDSRELDTQAGANQSRFYTVINTSRERLHRRCVRTDLAHGIKRGAHASLSPRYDARVVIESSDAVDGLVFPVERFRERCGNKSLQGVRKISLRWRNSAALSSRCAHLLVTAHKDQDDYVPVMWKSMLAQERYTFYCVEVRRPVRRLISQRTHDPLAGLSFRAHRGVCPREVCIWLLVPRCAPPSAPLCAVRLTSSGGVRVSKSLQGQGIGKQVRFILTYEWRSRYS